ncbi:hypothetical protein J4406_02700 [Candidatus Woesearchaeota archaeon]|nr:hypothetical protein [Candidatus Woesearchaeota archaeon]
MTVYDFKYYINGGIVSGPFPFRIYAENMDQAIEKIISKVNRESKGGKRLRNIVGLSVTNSEESRHFDNWHQLINYKSSVQK